METNTLYSFTLKFRYPISIPVILLICVCVLPGCSIFNGNFKAVEKNKVYRSGQLKGNRLESKLLRHDIRTVISLRRPAPGEKWYANEELVCQNNDVVRFDLPWSSRKIPSPESLNRLIELINEQPKPILFHCQSGVHRTAVASAIYQLNEGRSSHVAHKELGFFFLKAPIGDFLKLYPAAHSDFNDWVITEYPNVYSKYYQTDDGGGLIFRKSKTITNRE